MSIQNTPFFPGFITCPEVSAPVAFDSIHRTRKRAIQTLQVLDPQLKHSNWKVVFPKRKGFGVWFFFSLSSAELMGTMCWVKIQIASSPHVMLASLQSKRIPQCILRQNQHKSTESFWKLSGRCPCPDHLLVSEGAEPHGRDDFPVLGPRRTGKWLLSGVWTPSGDPEK